MNSTLSLCQALQLQRPVRLVDPVADVVPDDPDDDDDGGPPGARDRNAFPASYNDLSLLPTLRQNLNKRTVQALLLFDLVYCLFLCIRAKPCI
jgi:hypothetical protein